jgi:hypothetical protein
MKTSYLNNYVIFSIPFTVFLQEYDGKEDKYRWYRMKPNSQGEYKPQAYARAQLKDLKDCINQHDKDSDVQPQFWAIITNLIDWGLSVGYIDCSNPKLWDNDVRFDVPIANLYKFYRGLAQEIEFIEALSRHEDWKYRFPFLLEQKVFTRRLLRNGYRQRKTVRYKGKPQRGVVWSVFVDKYQFYRQA